MIEGWFVLELFGHIRHIGEVSEVEAFGGKMGRIEALQADGSTVSVMFSSASVFRLTPVTEDRAREMVAPYVFKALDAALDGNEETYRCACQFCACLHSVPFDGGVCGSCLEGAHQG